MAGKSWAQRAIDGFFAGRRSPTQMECDQTARSIFGASAVRPVDIPGSLSYTVVCTGCQEQQQDLIVSFRDSEARLDGGMVKLAKEIHGCLVPEATYHGMMSGADPPLAIYAMHCLPGISCLEALGCQVEMNSQDEARHVCYVKHLARYFARCWLKPQPVDVEVQAEHQAGIRRRLANLRESPSSVLPSSTISELEYRLPVLFSQEYPQVLTHGDLSRTNILVDKDTYEITGIVDWSLAAVLPFGMELDCLLLTTGYMSLSGWHNYACRSQLQMAFWDEFWTASGVEDGVCRKKFRVLADSAAKIAVVLRYAFQRNSDGSASEVVLASDRMSKYLDAWFSH
ncbi:hypothetical protein BKA61DRAFT_208000 [Leptodontidium sp. MPI-SDFR-AT-0119]|nr:hypothetical protein BKA61DRAFT_208000 [Leptodontidium sp. MPI-SDFR-AT-0119]